MAWTDVERTNESKQENKIPYTKFDAGTTTIRVLDDEPYSFWQHWLPAQNTSVPCMGKGCPICAVIAEEKANKITNKKYSSTQRHAIRIWNYKTNQMEIMIQGKNFFSQLLTLHREVGDITTYDIKVIRNGEGKETTYTLLPSLPTEFDIKEGIEEVDLAETFKAPEKEVILQLMEGKTYKEIYGNNENED